MNGFPPVPALPRRHVLQLGAAAMALGWLDTATAQDAGRVMVEIVED